MEVRVVLVREMSAVRQGKKGQQAGDLRVHERRGQDTGRVREFDDWSELQVENGLHFSSSSPPVQSSTVRDIGRQDGG